MRKTGANFITRFIHLCSKLGEKGHKTLSSRKIAKGWRQDPSRRYPIDIPYGGPDSGRQGVQYVDATYKAGG